MLRFDDDTIRALAAKLRDEEGVMRVAPAHCTGHPGFQVFQQTFGDRFVAAGLASEVPIGP
jgi:7,8-dihydropterin-6-yl-methyl-4-(beta-D-ribofuranosyl)aminobenzene 5'-phosphate synthase